LGALTRVASLLPWRAAPSCGILCGSGMGGLTVFQNSVQQLLTKARAQRALPPAPTLKPR
jgi:hypothetical protein